MHATAPQGRGRRRERGAALLIVMVAVALLTALAVDLAYQARVNLQIAGNGRDELKAQALARGSVALGRLVLHFQAQLDDASSSPLGLPGLAGVAGAAGLPGGAQGLQGAAGALAGGLPHPQLWKLVAVDSSLVANLFQGASGSLPAWARERGAAPVAPAAAAAGPGGLPGALPGGVALPDRLAPPAAEGRGAPGPLPSGTFYAQLDDEDRKVNAQMDGLEQGGLLASQFASYAALVADKRWDFLFDRDDANGQRTSRTDLACHLKDWVDDDQIQSAVTGRPDHPFENSFGDENFAYDRGPDRYKAKNARFDSLDELFLVTGVSDAFMGAFGDKLTVYLSRNAKLNVNTDDREELVRNARIMADPPLQPILYDVTFPERLERAVREVRLGGFVSMSPAQFIEILKALGLSVGSGAQQAGVDQRGGFTDRSRVFHVRGTARVGDVEKSIDTVVTFDPEQAREQAALLGRLIHWREE